MACIFLKLSFRFAHIAGGRYPTFSNRSRGDSLSWGMHCCRQLTRDFTAGIDINVANSEPQPDSNLFHWEVDQEWDLPAPILPPEASQSGAVTRRNSRTKNQLDVRTTGITEMVLAGKISVPTTMKYNTRFVERHGGRIAPFDLSEDSSALEGTIDAFYDCKNSRPDDGKPQVNKIVVARRKADERTILVGRDPNGNIMKNGSGCDYGNDSHERKMPIHNLEMLTEAYAVNVNELAENLNMKKWTKSKSREGFETSEEETPTKDLTPAQLFFLENRERLLKRAQDYHCHKVEHFEDLPDEHPTYQSRRREEGTQSSYFDTFYRDPVIRLPKNHLWDFGTSDRDERFPQE